MKKILAFTMMMLSLMVMFGCVMTTSTTTTVSTSDTTTTSTIPSSTSETTTTTTTETSTTTTSETTTTSSGAVERFESVDFYAMNDFHGGAYASITALANVSAYIQDHRNDGKNTVFLASGDMLQGTALSNYYAGLPIIEALDEMGLVGFTIGNHEFDWGIEKIATYADGDLTNGEANYPFLAANIEYTETGENLPWTEPYTIVETGNLKIGVIGVIGDVDSSISASRLTGIRFTNAVDAIAEQAQILRTIENCDIVVASVHYGSSIDSSIASLTGDQRVDAVFNGHTHANEKGTISRSGTALPYVQTSSSSYSMLGAISLTYDHETNQVTSASANVLGLTSLYDSDVAIEDLLLEYSSDPVYTSFVNEVLAYTPTDITTSSMARWGSSVIRDYMQVDIGILNRGGFRVSLNAGDITMGEMISVYPFDNYLKTVELTGSALTDLYFSGYDVVFDDSITDNNGHIYKDGVLIGDNDVLTVAAVDYVFDKGNYPFLYGDNITQTAILMRDLLVQDLRNTSGDFNPANGTSYANQTVSFGYRDYYRDAFASIL